MSSKRKRRVPQCARCRSHNTFSSVRGHKRECQWKDCTCAKCLMVTEKRRVTACRVAVLRRERKRRRMSHRMGFDAFHAGLSGASAWGMMGRVPGAYPADQFSDNRRMAIAGEPYYNEMLHLKYREMYHYGNKYHIYPGERLPCYDDEPSTADSAITQNLESFQHEYESFMQKLNENGGKSGELSPSNQFDMTSCHSTPDPRAAKRVCIPPTSPPLYINGPHMTHGDIYQPRIPHERPRYLPMMLNTPLTLPCPCPVKPRDIPYGVCM